MEKPKRAVKPAAKPEAKKEGKKEKAVKPAKKVRTRALVLKRKEEEAAIVEPNRLTPDKLKLLADTVARGADKNELALFLHVCQRTALDPFMKQIYFVKRFDTQSGEARGVIQVGIDGLRAIAERSGEYAGSDEPVFEYAAGDSKKPVKATVTVYRLVGSERVKFTASARWDEYYPGEKQGFMWRKMPHNMLGKCAEGLALRKAFPQAMAGLYVHEEMQQAGRVTVSSQPELEGKEAVDPKQVDAYQKASALIEKESRPEMLAEWRSKLETSKLYTDEQKKQLLELIDKKIAGLNGHGEVAKQ